MMPKPPLTQSAPSPIKPSTPSIKSTSMSRASSNREKQVPPPIPSDDSKTESDPHTPSIDNNNPDFLSLIHFQKCHLIRGRVIVVFGGPDMETLLSKLEFQGWSNLFLLGDSQCKFAKSEKYKFNR